MKLIKIDIYDLVSLLSNKMFIYFNKKIERKVKETQKESTFFSNDYYIVYYCYSYQIVVVANTN